MLARVMARSDTSFFQAIPVRSEAETAALGARIGALLRRGEFVTLAGALGAGKTVFARGLIRAFLPKEEVPSPTFTLVQTYETKRFAISHVDLYRVKAQNELRELGLDEALERGVLLIEWPDRMGEMLPDDRLDVILEGTEDENERLAKVVARGAWVPRIGDLEAQS
jgi:tRNA threonylcarbamoyl adenosine modification protein YjeE